MNRKTIVYLITDYNNKEFVVRNVNTEDMPIEFKRVYEELEYSGEDDLIHSMQIIFDDNRFNILDIFDVENKNNIDQKFINKVKEVHINRFIAKGWRENPEIDKPQDHIVNKKYYEAKINLKEEIDNLNKKRENAAKEIEDINNNIQKGQDKLKVINDSLSDINKRIQTGKIYLEELRRTYKDETTVKEKYKALEDRCIKDFTDTKEKYENLSIECKEKYEKVLSDYKEKYNSLRNKLNKLYNITIPNDFDSNNYYSEMDIDEFIRKSREKMVIEFLEDFGDVGLLQLRNHKEEIIKLINK